MIDLFPVQNAYLIMKILPPDGQILMYIMLLLLQFVLSFTFVRILFRFFFLVPTNLLSFHFKHNVYVVIMRVTPYFDMLC